MKKEAIVAIKNNTFLRQFEAHIGDGFIKLEYSDHPRKLFLTKFVISDDLKETDYDQKFFKEVFDLLLKDSTRVIPTSPEAAAFFKAHKHKYEKLLPSGINI